jgi:Flp pilus assembly pilin Flp
MLREKLGSARDALNMAYIKLVCKLDEIRRDEDAMEVIQVVMIIAIGVIALVAIWAAVNGLLSDIWKKITGATDEIGKAEGGLKVTYEPGS